MRVGWAVLGVLAACGSDAPVAFPGDVNPRWLVTGSGDSDGPAVVRLPDGNVLVAALLSAENSAATISIGEQRYTFNRRGLLLLELSGVDGSILASTQFEGLTLAARLAVGSDGDVFLASVYGEPVNLGGDDLPATRSVNHAVARLSGDDLSHVWSRSLDVTANLDGFKLDVDTAGDLIAVLENDERLYVEKLSAADGATLWSAEPVDGDSEARDAAILPDGDVVVAGLVVDPPEVLNPVIVRIAGDNGAVAWERRFTAAGGGATAEQVEVIDGEDLLVTGSTGGTVDVGGTHIDPFQNYAARLSSAGDVAWARDICDASVCYGGWPFEMRMRGNTVSYMVPVGLAGLDTDIVVQTISPSTGEPDATSVLSSSTGDVLGDLALDGDGQPILSGRTGWVIDPDIDQQQYGSLFVIAL